MTSLLVLSKVPLFPSGQLVSNRVRCALSPNDLDQQQSSWSSLYVTANSSIGVHSLVIKGLTKMNYYVVAISANNTSSLGWG